MTARARARDPLTLTCLCVLVTLAASTEYGIPIEIKLWDAGRTPLAHMVDITNEFGLKVLAEHNFLNDNNIAFSPYGLMGILVALYEGVDGESSYQIQRGMRLPWNRNVMRIGFRDIHRTLKTYFVPEEGFLAGLALNNENVTFNEDYKKVLRFYGFDLENDQLPTLSPENSTNTESSTVTNPEPKEEGSTNSTESAPVGQEASTTSMREDTTQNPNVETINEVDVQGPTTPAMSAAPVANAGSSPPATTTVPPNPIQEETTQIPTTKNVPTPLVTETTTTTISEEPSTMPFAPKEETQSVLSPTNTLLPGDSADNNEINTISSMNTATTLQGDSNPADMSSSMSAGFTTTTLVPQAASIDTPTASTVQEPTTNTESNMNTTPTESTTTVSNGSTIETLERRKKSVVDFIFTNPPYIDDYLVYRSYDVGLDVPTPNFDGTMFLANGLKSVQVTYMHYDTVLEHAYLPHLEAAALRLPLDSDRYYLLVVLPSRAGAAPLGRLLSRMARESDLSDIYSALRPRRVKAVVPSFTVKGHVTLTTDLQKMGIRDVFEPRQHDFTAMTSQAGVYVRSVEQAVSVAIRKYQPDDNKKNRYVTNRQPVTFTATYPFLYFVMDASIHVSLMAGKMLKLDPGQPMHEK